MPCFSSNFLENLQNDLNHFCFCIKETTRNAVESVKNLFHDVNQRLSSYEHRGFIISVDPLSEEIPLEYQDKCYHSIKLSDGSRFKMIFDDVEFDSIRDSLQRGRIISIIYTMPDYRVVNIYDLPYYKNMCYSDFLDEHDIPDDNLVRVTYFEGKIIKLEFITEEQDQKAQIIRHQVIPYQTEEDSNGEYYTSNDSDDE